MKPPVEPRDRERFLAAVAEQVPVDKVVELYLFQPIRQGGVESGVAVIAAAADTPAASEAAATAVGLTPPTDESEATAADAATTGGGAVPRGGDESEPTEPRYTVFTAHYKHVLKGPERGRWEVSVVAEADAPLATVGAVVRGVQRRAGDVEPPEHLTGDALREVLAQAPATDR